MRKEDPSTSNGRPGVGSHPARDAPVAEKDLEEALLRVIDEGRRRLYRPSIPLLATGAVGGIDVGTGILALLLVRQETDSHLLAGLAFSIGFIALALARSELFTEDFLIPVSTVIARQAQLRMLLRLWAGTLVANLVAGWIVTWFIIEGLPEVRTVAVDSGAHYVGLGTGDRAFALAVLGGVVITLMTWMQHGTQTVVSKVIASITSGFLLAGAGLDHAIVASLLEFSALHTGHAPFGYLQWARTAGFAAVGNIVGGVGLVTVLRLAQMPHRLAHERANPAPGVPFREGRASHWP